MTDDLLRDLDNLAEEMIKGECIGVTAADTHVGKAAARIRELERYQALVEHIASYKTTIEDEALLVSTGSDYIEGYNNFIKRARAAIADEDLAGCETCNDNGVVMIDGDPDHLDFCPACGPSEKPTAQSEPADDSAIRMVKCPTCGSDDDGRVGWDRCRKCGQKFSFPLKKQEQNDGGTPEIVAARRGRVAD